MKKRYFLGIVGFMIVVVSGCSNFRVTPAICDEINTQAGDIPKECRAYNEKEAQKAFDKVKDEQIIQNKDIVEFHKEKTTK
jgi:hypothetical protein